jgi:hypothetical protein
MAKHRAPALDGLYGSNVDDRRTHRIGHPPHRPVR